MAHASPAIGGVQPGSAFRNAGCACLTPRVGPIGWLDREGMSPDKRACPLSPAQPPEAAAALLIWSDGPRPCLTQTSGHPRRPPPSPTAGDIEHDRSAPREGEATPPRTLAPSPLLHHNLHTRSHVRHRHHDSTVSRVLHMRSGRRHALVAHSLSSTSSLWPTGPSRSAVVPGR